MLRPYLLGEIQLRCLATTPTIVAWLKLVPGRIGTVFRRETGMFVLWLAVIVLTLVSFWKIMEKAGRRGWEGILPIYNLYVLTLITGLSVGWFLLMLIPLLNIVAFGRLAFAMAKVFGNDLAFGLGLFLLGVVFYPILAFGNAKYIGVQPPATPPIAH